MNPLYVRFTIKDKITQLKLPEEVEVDKSKVERSKITGALKVTCPTVNKRPRNTEEYKKQKEEYDKKRKLEQLEKEMKEKDYAKKNKIEKPKPEKHEPPKAEPKQEEPYEPDFDLSELPDLE